MPDAGRTHGPPAIRKAGGSYHRFSRNNRHSLRDVLRLIARSPRGPGFLAPVARKLRKLANLASASGGQDHTPSPSAPTMLVLHHHRVHRIPPHDRDDAFAPLAEAGRVNHTSDLQNLQREYFCPRDGTISALKVLANFTSSRRRRWVEGPANDGNGLIPSAQAKQWRG